MTQVSNHGRFVFALIVGLFPIHSFAKAPVTESVAGQYLVELSDAKSLWSMRALEQTLGAKVVDRVRDDVVLVQRDPGESRKSAIESLRGFSFVKIVEPNYIYHSTRTPNDTNFKDLWGMKNTGAVDSKQQKGLPGVDISAESAWDISTGSKKVLVAIIDTGIDASIPDLAPNVWTNEAELNGQTGVDDDANGYVDDIHGYDFANNDGDPTDDHSHGSHCAGTIGGHGDDGSGVAGVNWDVTMMAVKFLDANGSGSLANAVKAIDYARKMGAKIMSNSWGGGGASALLQKAIEDARDANILFVAAAGNDSSNNDTTPSYPASYPVDNIVSVAAVDNRGQLAEFSNYGERSVHLAAPGVSILSTTPGGLKYFSGTSMATPHVSGVAALIAATEPTFGYLELKQRLLSSVRKLKSLDGKVSTAGMLNAYSALGGPLAADDYDPTGWTDQRAYSAETAHPYAAKANQTITIQIPGAKSVAARFSLFKTEANFDKVLFTNAAGEKLGEWSGERAAGTYSPIAEGDTLVIHFTSDDSVNFDGFTIDGVAVK